MDDLQLTKKAEAYVAAAEVEHVTLLTLQIDRTSRKALSLSITALIDMLDELDPDPDLEDGADGEPWLGWGERGPRTVSPEFLDGRGSIDDDRELEDEHGGDINDQPQAGDGGRTWEDDEHSLGWTEEASQTGNLGCFGSDGDFEEEGNDEPSLGWGNAVGQTGVGVDQWDFDADSGGSEGALVFTGEGHDIGRELVRGHRHKRPEPSLTIVGPVITVPGYTGPLSQADVDRADGRTRYWESKGF